MVLISRLILAVLAVPLFGICGTTKGSCAGGSIPAGAFATSGVVTSDIVLTSAGYVAPGNAVTVTLLGLQHDYAGDLQITLSYVSSAGVTLQSVDLLNRVGATAANPYGTAADFGNNQGNGDNYQFNTDYAGNLWNVAACADAPACTEPYGDADSLPGVSTDKINNGQYFTSTTGGVKTNLSYAFAGLSVNGGTWRLTITDAADPNAGSYVGWQISIVTVAMSAPANITAIGGTPQSATVSTAFGKALEVKVTDGYSNPVSGATITFTAPASGASATLAGSTSASAVTNSSGIATSPLPVANATAGTFVVSASLPGVTPAAFNLTNTSGSGSPQPTTFTTYLGAYGSGPPVFSGASTVLPLRGYLPEGASQMAFFWTNLNDASDGATEYQIWATSDGAGGYTLKLTDGTNTSPAWPYLSMSPSGSTVTLTTPITVGSLQIGAYRFALGGNEFQLDVSVTRGGTFSDQIAIFASYGSNYSSPWGAVDGQWSGNSSGAPAVTLSANSLNFGSQTVGTSLSQNIIVTNSGTALLSLSSLQMGGANAGDFSASGCTSGIPAGGNCTITVGFDPLAVGSRSATLSIADNASNSPQIASLSGSGSTAASPTSFTTYIGQYGSGSPLFHGASVVLPLRGYLPGGASQMAFFWASLNDTSSGATDYQIWATSDGAGGYALRLFDGSTNAPTWPYLTVNSSGTTITLAAPITLDTIQISAYRFALIGNEFQLDLSVTRTGSFNDQIVIFASSGSNYSAPWDASDGQWSNP